ncbi:Sir2 family histone deacetylase Hst2 [Coprinopsis marcescibilis]|uniref:NAD-dependent protein deacetylase n=1 Tax=Coprinopsis marcescibilis TaxID=230819 RepID=A0A5C3KS25_COPMA|nr:Sir2 family histone deacetylase Hst2 [Coprinopsis marcescibilis]
MPPPPKVLKRRDVPSLAKYINSDDCQNVVLMLGAGVSTAAGIPDFRSPKTGLYSNLARLNLPHPEAVFEINFFRSNPVPFYTLAHELYPGKFRPTLTHSFVRLLSEKGKLLRCFTQNIDTLERIAGVPPEKVIEAHGSFASQRCIDCHTPFDGHRMKTHILEKRIARCDRCKGLVKPDIVFFGESLPKEFIESMMQVTEADLLIVMGTSLTVQPFASLAEFTQKSCPRVLINLDRVGDFGSSPDDVILLGKCDETVRDLCKELGWLDELMELWDATAPAPSPVEASPKAKTGAESKKKLKKSVPNAKDSRSKKKQHRTPEEQVQDEVEQLTAAIEESLALTDDKDAAQPDKVQDAASPPVESVDKVDLPQKTPTDSKSEKKL